MEAVRTSKEVSTPGTDTGDSYEKDQHFDNLNLEIEHNNGTVVLVFMFN
jgi:hypothetical protein